MIEIHKILIVLGLLTKDAYAAKLVRNVGIETLDYPVDSTLRQSQSIVRKVTEGHVTADGRIEISNNPVDSTPKLSPSIVRKAKEGHVSADGSVEISDGVIVTSSTLSQSVIRRRERVRSGTRGHLTTTRNIKISKGIDSPPKLRLIAVSQGIGGVVDSKPKLISSLLRNVNANANDNIKNLLDNGEKVLSHHAIINGTRRLKSQARSLSTNKSSTNIQAHLVLDSGTHIQVLPERARGSALNEAEQNTIRRNQRWSFVRAAKISNNSDAHGSTLEVIRKNLSMLEKQQAPIAVHRNRKDDPLMLLLVVTVIFVFAGFLYAIVFSDQRHSMVTVINRRLLQENGRSPPRQRRRFSYNDFFNDFEIGEKLGQGAFAVVHVVRRDGRDFAAKMIDAMQSDLNEIREEIEILKRVNHESLTACCLYEYHDACFYYLVMPLYSGGDLSGAVCNYIETEGLLPETFFARLFEQMAKGVAFVQSKQVVHRDIKPENFLLSSSNLSDPKNLVVVADFGLAVVLDDGESLGDMCGTPIFWAPEFFEGKYEFKVDVFALGLSAYVLLTGGFAFRTEKEIKTWATSSDPPPIPSSVSPDTEQIIQKALARDVRHRVSAMELEILATKLRSYSFDDLSIEHRQSMEPETPKHEGCRTMGISGGQMQKHKADRRDRMLWELIRDHKAKTMTKYAGGTNVSAEVLAARPFEIHYGRRNRKVSSYDFWSRDACLKNHVSGIIDEDMKPLAHVAEIQSSDVQLLDDILQTYCVDRSKWGQGQAKSVADLAQECKSGICYLTEGEKRLERVVEIVVLVVMNSEGTILHQFPNTPKNALGKVLTRSLCRFTDPRLPAKKMEAWETVDEATDRILDMLSMSSEDVALNFDVPMRVAKEMSLSYPGLSTVYKKHMVEASIREDACSSEKLAQWGFPGSHEFVVTTEDGHSNWGWLSRANAERMGSLNEEEADLAMRYAEVLPVKTKVISGDRIKQMLKEANAKVDDTSDAALEELAGRIRTGEVELVEEEKSDGARSWKLKVTITMLRLAHQEGSILIEVSRSRLPGSIQHTFENPYYIARRLLSSRFMVAQGRWRMDKEKGGCIIEERQSDQLPGLHSIVTTNIVAARLVQ